MEKIKLSNVTGASLVTGASSAETMDAKGVYITECFDAAGNLKWQDVAYNTVTYQGKNYMLDSFFQNGITTPTWYMSLIISGSATTASTYQTPIVGEVTTGTIAARVAVSWSASASGSKSATTTAFSITSSATVTGNMVVTGGSGVTTILNTTATGGILFSSAAFTGGSKNVSSGDTLNVTYSISV